MASDEPRCEREMRMTNEPCTLPASFRVGSRIYDRELCCARHLAETVRLFDATDGHPVQVEVDIRLGKWDG